MSKIIDEVKNNINRQVIYNKCIYEGFAFDKYQKFYFCTNENIKGYINDIEDKESALSVLGSGDHLFNLIEKGIKTIDTFDTNLLTKYYVFGIRYAMIIKYNYSDYLKTIKILVDKNSSLEEVTSILYELLPYMDTRYRNFWKEIIDFNYNRQKSYKTNLNFINLISLGVEYINEIVDNNSYLSNETNYNVLKSNITKVNTTFKNIDAINLCKKYTELYDVILLSNIPEYFGKHFYKYDFEEYINDLKNMLTDNGIIFYNYIHKYKSNNFTRTKFFCYLNEESHTLINKEIKTIDSEDKVKSGVIILRKK